jgi:hypothetical protein
MVAAEATLLSNSIELERKDAALRFYAREHNWRSCTVYVRPRRNQLQRNGRQRQQGPRRPQGQGVGGCQTQLSG